MAITKIQSESLNLADDFAFTGTITGAGGINTPAFRAYATSSQTIPNTTTTTVVYNTEAFDTDNAFASNTFTVPSGKAGKYFFCAQATAFSWGAPRLFITLQKNNTSDISTTEIKPENFDAVTASTVVDLAVGDTINAKVYQDSGSSKDIVGNEGRTFFFGYKIIE
jgi:hypothetical protein